jgi:type II secretory pathway component GspD/PulD (secretin)
LIILITPYIIADDNDAVAVTDAFRKQLGGWAKAQPKAALDADKTR